MPNPITWFLPMIPVLFAGAMNAAPPVREAMVVADKTAPFFHAPQVDPNGTDYLLFKGNLVDLLKKEAARSYVKLPTGQSGLVASHSLEVKVTPAVRPPAVAQRKFIRARSKQHVRKLVAADREASAVPTPVFRY